MLYIQPSFSSSSLVTYLSNKANIALLTCGPEKRKSPRVYPRPRGVIPRCAHQIGHQKAENSTNQRAVEQAWNHDPRGAGDAVGVGRSRQIDQEHREKRQVIVLVVEPARGNEMVEQCYKERLRGMRGGQL